MKELKIVSVTSFGSKGEGIGRLDGKTLFIDGALPGEEVTVEIESEKPRWARGKLHEILKPSAHRVAPPCPYFDRCGGCQLMHLSYEGQLQAKSQRVVDALQRIGGLDFPVEPCLASPNKLHYRNKIQLPVVCDGTGKRIGLYAKGSHEVVAVEQCLIHCEEGERVYQVVKKSVSNSPVVAYDETNGKGELRHLLIRTSVSSSESLVLFVSTGFGIEKLRLLAKELQEQCSSLKGVVVCTNRHRSNKVLGSDYQTLSGEPTITEEICGLRFNVSPASFFQVNSSQTENLYRLALEFATLSSTSKVLDLYCGVGTLSLIAAQKAEQVVGVEVVEEAVVDAEENAARNGIANAAFVCGTVEKALVDFKDYDVAFLNPPRKGCHEAVIEALLKQRPKRLVYVSCDPATLARDLGRLSEGYMIERVQPVDMFPQTAHVETVVKLCVKPS
jgi:23S rRNA (uracil1939-C5)-methyltransferase